MVLFIAMWNHILKHKIYTLGFSLTRLNSVKTMTLNAKWCIRTIFEQYFETKDDIVCLLALFVTMFWKLEQLRKFESKLGQYMVHSEAMWNDVLEVGIAENILKAWTIGGAFWRYLKRCSRILSCWGNVKSNGAKRPSLKRCFGSWNCLGKLKARWQNGAVWR